VNAITGKLAAFYPGSDRGIDGIPATLMVVAARPIELAPMDSGHCVEATSAQAGVRKTGVDLAHSLCVPGPNAAAL
jgi:hypothetical protein